MGELALHALPMISVALLIRFYAQRWLRESHESGLHLAGGFLRMGTWWVYSLGFVYAVLGIKVPYIPTPKEGRQFNEWLLALPNLIFVLLLLVACKYARMTAKGTYTHVMVGLALLNVAVLLAAVAMGQHEAIRNFIQDMANRPYRNMVLTLHRLQANLSHWVSTQLYRFIRQVALITLAVVGTAYYTYTNWLSRVPPEWLLTKTNTVRIGQTLLPKSGPVAQLIGSQAVHTAPVDNEVVAVPIVASDTGVQLPAVVHTLTQHHQIPLLSWEVSAEAARRPQYWKALAQQLNELPGAVMLCPQLNIADAEHYRHYWRTMYQLLQKEKVINVVWVWTPESADVQLERFPGITYVNWIASDLNGSARTPDYLTLRHRLTYDLALHQMPLLLQVPAPAGSLRKATRELVTTYPEISMVVFGAPAPRLMPARATGSLTIAAH
jgi:cellulose synthase (UDP-forming)